MNPASSPTPPPVGRSLRIVHLLHTVAYGGIETILVNWLTHLDPKQVEVTMVVFANPGGTEQAFIDAVTKHGIKVRTIPWARRKPVFLASRRLAEILREVDADIVHAHNVYAEIVAYLAARKVGIKVLNTYYVWADFGWKRNIQQMISARVARRLDLVTNQCAATMRETTRRGVPESMQRILISGFEPCTQFPTPAEREAGRAREGITPDNVVLLNLARLYPEKAQALLLRAFRKIVDQRPHARLWILGVGPLEAELRALHQELNLGDTARLMGFHPNPEDFLHLADIQVHPSYAEGVPLALCEGMAVGLPIVGTAVGGVPEIVFPDRTGALVSAGDEAAFVEQCLRLIDDVPERLRLGAGGRAFLENEYTLEVAASHLIATYQEMMR